MAWSSDSGFPNSNRSDRYSYGAPNVRNKTYAFRKSSSSSSAESFPNHPRFFHFDRSSSSANNQQTRNFSSGFRGRGRGQGRLFGHSGFTNDSRRSAEGVALVVADKFSKLELSEVRGDDTNNDAINFDAYEGVEVDVTGSNVPPEVITFSDLDLGEALSNNIKRCNYVKPTPIQRHALPIAVAGRDLMACAQTGSGKTAAFCFPIISGILKNGVFPTRGGTVAYPSALILCPTRELACQINEEANKFAFQSGLKIGVAYGGAPIGQQFRNLKRGVDILVATPGRLSDMFARGGVSLKNVRYLALDEADRMLDMGFEPQIRKIVMQTDMPVAGSRQTMLFSATFSSEIQRLASDFLSNYIFLTVGRVGSSTELIAQRVEHVVDMDKRSRLYDILKSHKPIGNNEKVLTLVFVETKKGADALERWLSVKGFPAIAIHGDKVQMERDRALRSFKTGATPILVATDVASRGLDIPHVVHVVNFDLPKDIDSYVHRIGRTGRAGKSGTATAFFSEKDLPLAKSLVDLMQEANQEVPVWLSQYAERITTSGSSRSQHCGRSKFGGRDFRNDKQSDFGNDYYHGIGNGDISVDSNPHESRNSGFPDYSDSVVPTGWDDW